MSMLGNNHLRPVFVLVLFLIAAGGTPAWGQSAAQLRAENERLKSRVGDLEADLAAARLRIQALEEENDRLRAALLSRPESGRDPVPPPAPPAAPEVTIDESVPTASPRALLQAARASYEKAAEAWAARPGGGDVRDIRSWIGRFNRDHRAEVTWRVRILDRERRGRDLRLRGQAVDPVSGARLGEPFLVTVPRVLERRLELAERQHPGVTTWDITGRLVPQVRFNRNRAERGVFDKPPFLGPYAEFDFAFEASEFIAPPGATGGDPADGGTGRGTGGGTGGRGGGGGGGGDGGGGRTGR